MTKDFSNQVEVGNSSSSPNYSLTSSSPSSQPNFNGNIGVNADLGFLISDLRLACNEFYSLIRQIDTIAHKVEDKFSFILNNLENNYKNSTSPSSSSSSSEVISDISDSGNLKANRLQDISCLNNGKNLSDYNTSAEKIIKRLDLCNINNSIRQDNSLLNSNNRNSLNSKLISEIEKKTGLNYNDSVLNKNSKSIRSKSANPPANHNQDSLIKKSCEETDFRLEKIHEKIPLSIKNNSMESSFYEDKLDDELENFSCNAKAASLESTCEEDSILYSKQKTAKINNIPKYSTDVSLIFANSKQQQQTNNNSSKSLKPSNHVYFNLNNAIYTTRQDTPIPIPISILKSATSNEGNMINDVKKSNIKPIKKAFQNDNVDENNQSSSGSIRIGKKTLSDKDIENNSKSPLLSIQKYPKSEPKTSIL